MTRDVREHSIMIANLAYDEGREFGSKTRPAFVLKSITRLLVITISQVNLVQSLITINLSILR